MKPEHLVAVVIVGGGGLYLLARSGVIPGLSQDVLPSLSALGLPVTPYAFTPAQQLALNTIAAEGSGPGNAPAVPGTPFFGTPQGAAALDTGLVGAAGLIDSALITSSVVAGVATLGIGLAVTFFTYEWMKQQASIAANRWRDSWQKQFIALSDALGIDKLDHAGAGGYSVGADGTSNGNIEMSRVIFYFDHDSTGRLWTAVTKTQNLAQIEVAARAIDVFLKGQGVPVQGP